jgi:hypothetical protein
LRIVSTVSIFVSLHGVQSNDLEGLAGGGQV